MGRISGTVEGFGFLIFPERAAAPPVGLAQGAWENGPNGLGGSMSVELISVLIAVLAIGATLAH